MKMYKGTPKNPPVQALKNGLTWHIFMQNENFLTPSLRANPHLVPRFSRAKHRTPTTDNHEGLQPTTPTNQPTPQWLGAALGAAFQVLESYTVPVYSFIVLRFYRVSFWTGSF